MDTVEHFPNTKFYSLNTLYAIKTRNITGYIMEKQPDVPCPLSCRTLRSVVWQTPTFRDNLSVPSSRVKQTKKLNDFLNLSNTPRRTKILFRQRRNFEITFDIIKNLGQLRAVIRDMGLVKYIQLRFTSCQCPCTTSK